jgi:SAM-dependent methyltransferase
VAPAAAAPADHTAILGNPNLAGKLLALRDARGYSIVPAEDPHPTPERSALDGLPIPPTDQLRLWYGASPEDYVASGRRDVERMLAILADAGVAPEALARVLDVGCGGGRMLRAVPRVSGVSEHWGVDISALHVEWCQRHLAPPMRFAVTTTAPHLPFPDATFDLVYGGSLFTHIDDLADAWFLELLRVLRPGGHAYVTIHDEHIIDWLLGEEGANDRWMGGLAAMLRRFEDDTGVVTRGYRRFSIAADHANQVQTFFDSASLVRTWGTWATFVSRTPGAYAHQTALLFRR